MKNLLVAFSIVLLFDACTSNAEQQGKSIASDNYVVILDLSDRIIQKPDQVNIDTNAIRAVLEKFEKSVQKNLVVKSRDRFSLRIISQKNSSLPGNSFENYLSIDLGKYTAAEKLVKLNEFKLNFSSKLGLLYQQALLGNKTSDYAGVDIWQYFNEQVNSDLSDKFNNKVLILTDGYFDFEDKRHGLNDQNLYTTTSPLLAGMKKNNWKHDVETKKLGLIPVKLNIPATWLVCGIQPKVNCKDILESEKLSCLWESWLKQSGGATIQKPIINSSSEKMKGLIINNL